MPASGTLVFDELSRLEEFREVERLESEIWGPIDLVPVPILAVSVRRGAVLIGARDGSRLAGFVYSFPALRRAAGGALQTTHWSHMLGVHPDYQGSGLGRRLKLAQRERVLALGLDLIEWTFDPLQARNAHLNFARLGVVVEEYEENVYGESASPLHGGLPTDRFVCQWWIRRPHVERRIRPAGLPVVAAEAAAAPLVTRTAEQGGVVRCVDVELGRTDERLAAEIPADFTAMLGGAVDAAREWRVQTRRLFAHYLQRGYRVVDFGFDPAAKRGRYLLTTIRSATPL